MKYLARHNKVWQRIADKKTLENELELPEGESLSGYRQVPKPVEASKDVAKGAKPTQGNGPFSGEANK